jgi:hypothetical protein
MKDKQLRMNDEEGMMKSNKKQKRMNEGECVMNE